jgi:hypothetical protein
MRKGSPDVVEREMSEFSTEAVVEATVDPGSLRDVRRTVEEGLADIETQVAVQTGSVDTGSRPATGRGLARNRQHLAEQTDQIDENLRLNERRNALLEDILDAQEQDTFNRASGGGGSGLVGGGAFLAAVTGVGLGGGLISFLKGFEFGTPDIPPLKPPDRPDWIPIDVTVPDDVPAPDSDPAPVKDPNEVPIGEPPKPYPVGEPKGDYPIEDPSGSPDYPIEDPSTGPKYPVEDVPDSIDVNAPDSIDLGITITPEQVISAVTAGGIAAGVSGWLSGGGSTTTGGSAGASGIGFPTLAPIFGNAGRQAERKAPDERNFIEQWLADITEDVGTSRTQTSTQRAQLTTDRADRGPDSSEVTVDVTINQDGVSERDLERGMDRAKQDALDEFRREFSGR